MKTRALTALLRRLLAALGVSFVTLAPAAASGDECGDGIRQGAEECDDGSANSDSVPDACRTECVAPRCGDGVVDSGEDCDEGTRNSDEVPNQCRLDCTTPACGDGLIDALFGEFCDDGNRADGDGCDRSCRVAHGWSCYGQPSFCSSCGNGEVDGFEECDDGPANSDTAPDACRRDCTWPRCGDGVADTGYGEACDDGASNSDFAPDTCRRGCSLPRCGDDVHDPAYGEECDLGAANSDEAGSECSTRCLLPACGDGVLNRGEMCEPSPSADCNTECRPNHCGDGVVSTALDPERLPVERCDDGNERDGDECRYDCRQDMTLCGNGAVDPGESCDEGAGNADTPGARCRTTCQRPRCGDGVVDGGELCDGGAGCGADCRPGRR